MKVNSVSTIIKQVSWEQGKADLQRIRSDVFMIEQGVSAADEWDGEDDAATHFLGFNASEQAIATARVITEHGESDRLRFHIGRVAVLKPYRYLGVGQQIMQVVMTWCLSHGAESEMYLYAQTTRTHFYERLGFVAQGDEFLDAGIPHLAMWYRPKY